MLKTLIPMPANGIGLSQTILPCLLWFSSHLTRTLRLEVKNNLKNHWIWFSLTHWQEYSVFSPHSKSKVTCARVCEMGWLQGNMCMCVWNGLWCVWNGLRCVWNGLRWGGGEGVEIFTFPKERKTKSSKFSVLRYMVNILIFVITLLEFILQRKHATRKWCHRVDVITGDACSEWRMQWVTHAVSYVQGWRRSYQSPRTGLKLSGFLK